MKKLFLIILPLFTLSWANATRQNDTLEIINIKSSINGSLYQLYIRTPANYNDGQDHPAILLLDANYYHRTFVNLYDSIVKSESDNQVVVGIGYLPNPMNDTLFIRDFTPSKIEEYPNSGRAEVFKQVLEEELIPAIIKNYRIDESKLSIVAHHYSALFLTWLLTQEAPKFSNYVICSPVLTFCENFSDFKNNEYNTGVYLSLGSGKIKFLDNPEVNKERFIDLSDQLKHDDTLNLVKSSIFESTLRYDDLYLGFSEGISFIKSQTETVGNRNRLFDNNQPKILERSTVLIEQVMDPITLFPYEVSTFIPLDRLEDKLPVIVILDSDFNYTELLNEYQQLMNEGMVAPSIVVGVGYGTSIMKRGNYRNRDFLPNEINDMESGNADNFAAFLNVQLIKYLSQYPVDKSNITLHAHSYGGLFLTHLLTKDNLFYKNLIISSPALWQDKSVLKKLKRKDRRITQNIFLSSGQLNDNDKDAKQLDKALNKKASNLRTILYPNDSHLTVISSAFRDALIFFEDF